jgi:hypothetical protein
MLEAVRVPDLSCNGNTRPLRSGRRDAKEHQAVRPDAQKLAETGLGYESKTAYFNRVEQLEGGVDTADR